MTILAFKQLKFALSCFKIYPIFLSEKEEMKENDGGIKEENQVPAGN